MKAIIELSKNAAAPGEPPVPFVMVRVRDRYGTWASIPFRVDTGASVSAIPTSLARLHGIGFQQHTAGRVRGLVGVASRFRDRMRVRIGNREHDWPCHFIDVPAEAQQGAAAGAYGVLGRAGFLDDYAITIDAGLLIITRLDPVRRQLRRWLHGLWAATGRIRGAEEPL